MMTARHFTPFFILFALLVATCAQAAPLVSGGAPPCSKKMGSRQFRSATAWDAGIAAFISGNARHVKSGCQTAAQIHIDQGTKARAIKLPNPSRTDFAIVDFSPDGTEILLSAETRESSPNEQFRYLQIGTAAMSRKDIPWRIVWDILGL